jgi:Zn-finger nucleic acid-binding protein
MRLLVACPHCKRQFDATGRAIGSRFRCHCGTVVRVRQPHGHSAAVVRCSSCGGPRQDGTAACAYCGADFTLHEQDLDTVCPQCLARVSDRAKFCHYCGVALVPEPLLGEKTSYACPACDGKSRLRNRQVGDVALLECGRCAGFWVVRGVFDRLIERATQNSLGPDWLLPGPQRGSRTPGRGRHGGPLYRQCPLCGKLMGRINYGRRSGVIIDSCRDHGAWFDAEELALVLDWVRSGGLAEARRQAADETARHERLAAIARQGRFRGPFTRELHQFALGAAITELFR